MDLDIIPASSLANAAEKVVNAATGETTAILIDKNSKIIVQELQDLKDRSMLNNAMNMVAMLVVALPRERWPNSIDANIPVFNTCKEARQKTGANVFNIYHQHSRQRNHGPLTQILN